MPSPLPGSADASNTFEDLSGVDSVAYANPYDALIEACHNDPTQIQARYSTHRTTRNGQQKAKLLAPDFPGLILDSILQKLCDPSLEPGFQDPRNCLVFWARPPANIRSLIDEIQKQLLVLAPNLWLMPLPNLHMTALELTHSLTSPEITSIISAIGPDTITTMTDLTFSYRARLIKPLLSYDGAAIALSFLPAAGESLHSTRTARSGADDAFSYHHLRQSLFNIASKTGVRVDSRYVVPSSHITIGRFLTQADHDSPEKMRTWIAKIEEINAWLEKEFWPPENEVGERQASTGERNIELEWIVGQERGLDCRQGTLWYGGGSTVRLGKGF